jgi:flagellar biogenesis protein FliO
MLNGYLYFIGLFQQSPTTSFESMPTEGSGSFIWMLLQTIFALGVVCGLIYLIFRWILPKLGTTHSTHGMVDIIDSVGIEPRKHLYVIKVAGRWMLISSSDAGVQFISELDAETAEEEFRELADERARQQEERRLQFNQLISRAFKGRK